ncbi:putative pectinesterase 10 [Cardamine amara subsp. amara]|uniref:pectinesterase n=1 Tax=Cardamine amara subsp. amara TaxID=228776 RepID=A0ABD1B3U7_CARAN
MKSLKSILALSFLFLTATSSLVCSDGLERKDLNEDVVKTVVVSPNGAANFKTIQEAIDYIPSGNSNWIKIILSPGIYNEKIVIPKEKQKIIMQGNSASEVTIQYNDAGLSNSSGPITVNAEYFVAINITFKNYNCSYSTPIIPYEEIKVAPSIILMADMAWFYGCNFISVQDTLADLLGRHYFRNCYIEGAIDFIWGNGQSIYQNCVINVKGVTSKGVVKGGGMLPGFITAQGRENEKETSGFVFKNCVINGDGMASLGRAYRGYSRVVFYETNIANIIVPQGWDAWDYKGQEDKFTYAEVNCIGEGANKSGRVMWEKNLSAQEIDFLIEPKTFIDEDGWMGSLPSSLVSLLSPSSIF